MSNENKILIGIGIVTLVLVVVAVFSLGGSKGLSGNDDTTDKTPKDMKVLIKSDSHVDGPANAKVSIVEFGDFQCPACGSAYPVVSQIEQNYKGKIKLVFRQYPLPVHKNAKVAAEAAEAAGAQGKFFEMYHKLYDNQKSWSDSNNALDEFFVGYAKDIKLDVNKFTAEVKASKYATKIQNDINDGNAVGVQATPTFYINGVEQVGGLPYDDFKTKVDEALKNAK
jgi:protein-disulfide isomerase